MMRVEKNYKDKVTSNDTQCPNCKIDLQTHTDHQILKCAQNELLKLNSLESDSTPESSDETPTGGFTI